MAYNSGLASEILSIVRDSSAITALKEKIEIVYIVALELGKNKELFDTAERILQDSGLIEHFLSWCIEQNIRVLDRDDFMDFLRYESFSSNEKLVLPLVNPRITFFPEVLTTIVSRELRDL